MRGCLGFASEGGLGFRCDVVSISGPFLQAYDTQGLLGFSLDASDGAGAGSHVSSS